MIEGNSDESHVSTLRGCSKISFGYIRKLALQEERDPMARYDWNQKSILIYERGVPVGNSIRRIVFQNAGASLLRKERPDAAGFCNYQGAIAAVHRNLGGDYFIERAEPLIRGFKPLVGIWD